MQQSAIVTSNAPRRTLIRMLRNQPDLDAKDVDGLPESVLWQSFCELKRRGEDKVHLPFLRAMRTLHRRRCMGVAPLTMVDSFPDEHKLTDDPLLSELWKAYKRCICSQRNGPAGQLLQDIEAQIS